MFAEKNRYDGDNGKDVGMTETTLKLKVLKHLKAIPNSFTMKISDKWTSGYPDILFVWKGTAYFFELKSSTGRKAPLQVWTIDQLNKAGAKAYFIYSLEEIKKILLDK